MYPTVTVIHIFKTSSVVDSWSVTEQWQVFRITWPFCEKANCVPSFSRWLCYDKQLLEDFDDHTSQFDTVASQSQEEEEEEEEAPS